MKIKILNSKCLLLLGSLFYGLILSAQQLPMPHDIIVGQLNNGFTYYIVPNGEQGKVKLMMLSKIGAFAEKPGQHGYAHFIEHSLFNGSKNYPGLSSVEIIEKMGMRPAIDYNAYTSTRSTECFMTVPEDNFEYFKKATHILKDWMFNLSINEEAHENEKKIIIEEIKRAGSNKGGAHFIGSQLEGRTVLGTQESINAATVNGLYQFYTNNYTPNHLALIVYGQTDTKQAIRYIRKLFGDVNSTSENANQYIDVNNHTIINGANRANRNVALSIAFKTKSYKVDSHAAFKQSFLEQLLCEILEKRLSSYKPELEKTTTNIGSIIPGNMIYNFRLSTYQEAKYTDMLDAFCYIMAQAKQYGFSKEELQYHIKKRIDWYAKGKGNESISLKQMQTYFLEGKVPMTGKDKYKLLKEVSASVTQQDLLKVLSHMLEKHVNVNYDSTSTAFTAEFDNEYILKKLNTIDAIQTELYKFDKPEQKKLEQKPIPVDIEEVEPGALKERLVLNRNLLQLAYENGIKVIVNRTTNEDMLIKLVGKDGLNIVPAEDRQYASMLAGNFYDAYGSYTTNDAYNLRRSWGIYSASGISNYGFEYSLTGKEGSFEAMLQIMNLSLTRAKPFDSDDIQGKLERLKQRDRPVDEGKRFVQDRSVHRLDMISDSSHIEGLGKRLTKYRQLLSSNFQHALIYISGALPDNAEHLISKYIGSLPVSDITVTQDENFNDILPASEVIKDVEWNSDMVKVEYLFTDLPKQQHLKDELILQAVGQYGIVKMMQVLREKYGLVYALGMTVEAYTYPANFRSLSIRYMLDPNNADRSRDIILNEVIKPMSEGSITKDEFIKIKAMMRSLFVLSFYESGQLENKWLSWMLKYNKAYTPKQIDELINRVSRKDIQLIMQGLVDCEKHFVILRMPEDMDKN